MADDGLEPVDVTGRWVGFYRHRWGQLGTYPIIADLNQTGNRITGEMYDQITDQSNYLDSLLAICGRDISSEARRGLEAMIRRFGAEIVGNSRLPDTSDIQGRIAGNRVEFTKTYRGVLEMAITVREHEVGSLRWEGHKVQYLGHLDLERICIAGRWVISHRGFLGWILPPQSWGSFELYKKS
jgi:hypothetical protein